ncbi:MAG: TusE/DsrC/DsvC family sulfur relay protein, partial [Sutterellaceae bacterium]|nr:TusE/DsrC/DsvC family sulfur relay protein [Burkholderiaceae bacterium]MDW8429245.1 TusE/DsrC/DsvC family sulfur relay protein [Sutterellaceae bacterium]
MQYEVNGEVLQADDEGYLLEPRFDEDVVHVIAAAEGIALTEAHWKIINYLRDQYRERG